MSINSSSNSFLPPPSLSSSTSVYQLFLTCFSSKAGVFNITAFTITSILLLLPLCILVLYLGFQRWRQQRSGTAMRHSDLLTYYMIVMELLNVFGFSFSCCGVHTGIQIMVGVGIFFFTMNILGQMLFHSLMCVERYLAVVHPVTYLSLRKAKGIRIRNITIGCVWLLCMNGTGLMWIKRHFSIVIIYIFDMSLALIISIFCSLSVLHVLIRPGPGDGGGDRPRVGKSKLRAFYTIMVILVVLLFRFGGSMLATALHTLSELGDKNCGVWLSIIWFCLPSSLVSPLLYLQRAGKLGCCKKNNKSGQGSG